MDLGILDRIVVAYGWESLSTRGRDLVRNVSLTEARRSVRLTVANREKRVCFRDTLPRSR